MSQVPSLAPVIPYAVSKAALNHLTRLLATQLGPEIRVNSEAEEVWANSHAWITANTPLRSVGSPQGVAEAVAYLTRGGTKGRTGAGVRRGGRAQVVSGYGRPHG
ncbi:SDR family oxidoreductase [Streptomyces sp. CG1]|uniref:SDR family oxidoreductase n=1 Tax=Streptomyces sp. CG1 TaxID=1287523 RepID=UPI0034E28960